MITYILVIKSKGIQSSEWLSFSAASDDAARLWVERWCKGNDRTPHACWAGRSVALHEEQRR